MSFMTSLKILKSEPQLAEPRLGCILVTIIGLYSISNVASFTADCKTIMLVYYLVSDIQDGGGKTDIQTTFL